MSERLKPAGSDCERCYAYEPAGGSGPWCILRYELDKGLAQSLEPCPNPVQFRKYSRLVTIKHKKQKYPTSTQPTGIDDQEAGGKNDASLV